MSDNKQHKKIRLLESELDAIKGSRSYKMVRTAGVIKTRLRQEPLAFSGRVMRTAITDPRRIIRLVKGRQVNPAIAGAVNNRTVAYHSWLMLNEPDESELATQRQQSQALNYQPLISILTPVFDPPIDVLQELLESVLGQTYPHFELCLGNFGKDFAVKQLLDEYAERDARVKVYEFTENKGIASNSNAILEKVSGEFIGLLDHDDTLSADALYENVYLLNQRNYDFLFSDKDMMDDQGMRYEPLFKPTLSPETMLNANYLTHFDIMRTSVVKQVGGWDSQTDGAQDWDLFLKIMLATDKIVHIPKILYHWRVIATSTAHSIDTKPYALAGQRKAVQKYLDSKGIHAKPFHVRTELLLEWGDEAVDPVPQVVLLSHNLSDTMQIMARFKRSIPQAATITIVHGGYLDEQSEAAVRRQGADNCRRYMPGALGKTLNALIDDLAARQSPSKTMLFIDDQTRLPKDFSYAALTGWLSIPGVGAAGGKMLDVNQNVVDCGAVLTPDGIVPIFQKHPSYSQSYLGNVEWVRDLRVVSRNMFATLLPAAITVRFDASKGDAETIIDFMLRLSQTHRLVVQPKVAAYLSSDQFQSLDQQQLLPVIREILAHEPFPGVDRYSNPNVHTTDPQALSGQEPQEVHSDETPAIDQYQHDALILANSFDITVEELLANQKAVTRNKPINPQTIGWFLPSYDAIYAGLMNIFSFANYLQEEHNLKTTFYILKNGKDASAEKDQVVQKFPALKKAQFVGILPDQANSLPPLDIGICTLWSTAFVLAKHSQVKRKCYFIQDKELNFYPQGSVSALVDLTYRFGFMALANTPGLLEFYQKNYHGGGVVLKSVVSLDAYYPREDKYYTPQKPYRVFFYARPNMPRNGFELGVAGLKKLKQKLGSKVEIIMAGALVDATAYGVEGLFTNLGKIPYDAVPELYRSMDAGLMFMFSGHPGVTASELMASGCPVVVNEFDDATWNDLYRHEKTCLVTAPTASEIARNLLRCLEDQALRKKIIDGGCAKVSSFYSGYEASQSASYRAILKG
jgi:glycosyltransferase involved in cell wall biosynthesis